MGRLSFETPQMDHISGITPILDHRQLAMGTFQVAWRHRRVVFVAVSLALLAGLALLLLRSPTYTAESILQLDVAGEPAKVSSIFSDTPAGAGASLETSTIVQSEAAIIKSPLIAHRVVERLGLANLPDNSFFGWLSRTVSQAVQKVAPATQDEDDNQEIRVDRLAERLIRDISVETDSRSYLLTILVNSSNAARSVGIASAIVDEYLKMRRNTSAETATRTVDWLTGVIADKTKALYAAEKDVALYRNQYNIVGDGAGQEDSSHQQFVNLQNDLSAATVDRMGLEDRLAQLQEFMKQGTLVSASNLQSLPSIQTLVQREATARVDLAELLSRYKPGSPRAQHAQAALAEATSLLTDEVRRSVVVMKAGLETAIRRENDLKHQLDKVQGRASSRAEIEAGFRRLRVKEQTIQEQLLLLERNRYHATAIRDLLSAPATLIMPAELVPGSAVMRITVIFIGSTIFGLVVGVMAALLLERGNRGFRSSMELQRVSDVRCLGMIPDLPRLPHEGRRNPALMAMCNQAVRSVGAEIGLFDVAQSCRVVLVTSAVQNEGAATLGGALAEMLAAAGKRVLLIGDSTTGTEAQDVATFSRSLLPLSDERRVVRPGLTRSAYSDFDVFKSERLSAALDSARAAYDVILIESPPIKFAADGLVLGRLADTVVLAVRWAKTDRNTVLSAMQRLRDNAIEIAGIVLMDVDLSRHARLGLADECFYYNTQQLPHRQVPSLNATGLL